MTNAGLIFWGFCFEDIGLPWAKASIIEYREEWQDYYAHAMGLVVPEISFKSEPEMHQVHWKEKEQLLENGGCEIEWPGMGWSDSCPFVHVEESAIYAASPQLEPIDPKELKIKLLWKTKLEEFCEIMEIPFGQPGWFLTSIQG